MAEVAERHPDATDDRGLPFWVKALGWLQVVVIALALVAFVVLQGVQAASSGVNYDAAAFAVILALPLIIVWQQQIAALVVAGALVVGIVLGVRFRRGRMSVGQAVWGYTLLGWTLFWVTMCAWGFVRLLFAFLG